MKVVLWIVGTILLGCSAPAAQAPVATSQTLQPVQASTARPVVRSTPTSSSSTWERVVNVNQSQDRNGILVTIVSVAFSTPGKLLAQHTPEQIRLMELEDARHIVGLNVRVKNNSTRDVDVYPAGIGTLALFGDEQSEAVLFGAGSIGGAVLAGASNETLVLFPLKRVDPNTFTSFRYRFDDYDFTIAGLR